MRRALARPSLIEQHDTIGIGIEQPPAVGQTPRPWTAVEKYCRLAVGISRFLEIYFVRGRDRQSANVIRLNRRIENAAI